MTHHRHVSAAAARRFLVRRHLLAPPRSLAAEAASVMRVVDRLGSLQFDPLEASGHGGAHHEPLAHPGAPLLIHGHRHASPGHERRLHDHGPRTEGGREARQQEEAHQRVHNSSVLRHGGHSLVFSTETRSRWSARRFTMNPDKTPAARITRMEKA